MQLKFYAKSDLLVTAPGQAVVRRNADDPDSVGAPLKYVGRTHVPAKLDADRRVIRAASNPASEAPYTCQADSEKGRRLMKLCRRDGSLWPADRETAAACGVPFVETKFVDGEHVPANPVAAPTRQAKLAAAAANPTLKNAASSPEVASSADTETSGSSSSRSKSSSKKS